MLATSIISKLLKMRVLIQRRGKAAPFKINFETLHQQRIKPGVIFPDYLILFPEFQQFGNEFVGFKCSKSKSCLQHSSDAISTHQFYQQPSRQRIRMCCRHVHRNQTQGIVGSRSESCSGQQGTHHTYGVKNLLLVQFFFIE